MKVLVFVFWNKKIATEFAEPPAVSICTTNSTAAEPPAVSLVKGVQPSRDGQPEVDPQAAQEPMILMSWLPEQWPTGARNNKYPIIKIYR